MEAGGGGLGTAVGEGKKKSSFLGLKDCLVFGSTGTEGKGLPDRSQRAQREKVWGPQGLQHPEDLSLATD